MELRDRHEDREIEQLFEDARREETTRTPPFAVPLRSTDSCRRWPAPRRALGIAGLTAAASILVAFAATWLALREDAIEQFGGRAIAVGQESSPAVLEKFQALGYTESGDETAALTPSALPPAPPAPVRSSPQFDVAAGAPQTQHVVNDPALATVEVQETVNVAAKVEVIDLQEGATTARFSENFVQDLPTPGRFYTNVVTMAPGVQDADGDGNPNVHGTRSREYQTIVGGASNLDPMTGQKQSRVNPNSIQKMQAITAGAGVKRRTSNGLPAGVEGGVLGGIVAPEEFDAGFNTETYQPIVENEFLSVAENPLSTFSIDVDTASYANVRRFLTGGSLPPADAVRIEELINYFRYDYPQPAAGEPFSATIEIADCPWNQDHRLARIGLQGRALRRGEHRGSNLVFLIDVSGSMSDASKLPLLQPALALLADQLDGRDQVAIVVYAGSSGLVLPPTSGGDHATIKNALDRLRAGGSTNGGEGLRLAYKLARENFVQGGNNRVILATDGDFNVGVTSQGEMLQIIKDDAKNGIFLTVLGVGTGNYKDASMEHLADRGNGNYAYLDTLQEAQKVLVEELTSTLFVIAKDVKIQIEFNPAVVGAYRLIGYENRLLKKEDFNDDRKDAGEIGAGHTVTALYELVPPDRLDPALPAVDELKYQLRSAPSESAASGEAFTLKLRYKEPDGDTSKLLTFAVHDEGATLDAASADFKFAAAVAAFGMALRDSTHRGALGLEAVRELAVEGAQSDSSGRRAELWVLIDAARGLLPGGEPRDDH